MNSVLRHDGKHFRVQSLLVVLTFLILFSAAYSAQNRTAKVSQTPLYLIGNLTTTQNLLPGQRELSGNVSDAVHLHGPHFVVGMRREVNGPSDVRTGIAVETLVNGDFVPTGEIIVPDALPRQLSNLGSDTVRFRAFVEAGATPVNAGAAANLEIIIMEGQNF